MIQFLRIEQMAKSPGNTIIKNAMKDCFYDFD